jgi:monoterpene epsilon-lactone hydrolase
VGGDSAGGNLTITLINRLRAAGEPLPACAWLISPWTDLTMSGATLDTKDAVDPIIHKDYLCELADAYLPRPVDRKDPLISPLFADLRGFPPTLIQVGSAETLLSDATRFAAAAGSADVDVTLEIWPHMIHAWPLWNAKLEDGRRCVDKSGGVFPHSRRRTLSTVCGPRRADTRVPRCLTEQARHSPWCRLALVKSE